MSETTTTDTKPVTTSEKLKSGEDFELWQDTTITPIDGGRNVRVVYRIVTPAQVNATFDDASTASHIYAQLTETAAENRKLKAAQAQKWAQVYEEATLQAEHDHHEHAKVRIARIKDAVAHGQRISKPV